MQNGGKEMLEALYKRMCRPRDVRSVPRPARGEQQGLRRDAVRGHDGAAEDKEGAEGRGRGDQGEGAGAERRDQKGKHAAAASRELTLL